MARYVFKCFHTCFEIGNLLSIGHGFICSFLIHLTEQGSIAYMTTILAIEMNLSLSLDDASPSADLVSGILRSEVIRDTRLTPNETWWVATRTFTNSVMFTGCCVLHHAG